MSTIDDTWPLDRSPEDVMREVIARGERRRRARRNAIGSVVAAIAAVAIIGVAVRAGDDPTSIDTVDAPETPVRDVTTTTPAEVGGSDAPVPTTTAPASPSTSITGASASTRLFDDPRGDVESPLGLARDADPALDLLALEASSGDGRLSFTHLLAGSPDVEPTTSDERGWEVSFWVPGFQPVVIVAQTFPSGVDVAFYVRGGSAVHRCPDCRGRIDAETVTVSLPLDELNGVTVPDGGGSITSGTTLTGFGVRSFGNRTNRQTPTGRGYLASDGDADRHQAPDATYTVR